MNWAEHPIDWERYLAYATVQSAKEGARWYKNNYRKNQLQKLLKKDFENMTLPEEVDLSLYVKNIDYPLLIIPGSEIPSKIKRFVPLLDLLTSIEAIDIQRIIYQFSVLIDNFLPSAKALLDLEAIYGLLFAEIKIRAFRNGEHRLEKMLGKLVENPDPCFKKYISDLVEWNEVEEWVKKFYTLFEGGLFFSVILPKMNEIYAKRKRITKGEREEFMKYVDHFYKIEKSLREKNKVDKDLLIFNGRLLGKIGIILVNPPSSAVFEFVPALIEEKLKNGCLEIVILSRWLNNNLCAIEGVLESIANLPYEKLGIKSIKVDESYSTKKAAWATALRIIVAKNYRKHYTQKIRKMEEKMEKNKKYIYEPHGNQL